MTYETKAALPPAEVLARAKAFFAVRVPANAAFLEREGPDYLILRGQGGEEVALGAWPDAGGTRVRASTLFYDQALQRFFSTLPPLAQGATA